MPNYVRSIVLETLGDLWTLREDRQRIKRRLGALQNLSLMKNNIKNELENIKNGLSGSNVGLECGREKILVENCNGDCYHGNKGEIAVVKFWNFNLVFTVKISNQISAIHSKVGNHIHNVSQGLLIVSQLSNYVQ